MANRPDALFIDSLGNGWNQSTAVAGTAIALTQPCPKFGRVHLTQLSWSIKNMSAAASTVGLQVRDSSVAGTLLAQWNIITTNAQSKEDAFNLNIQGLKNNPVFVGTDTAVASVTVAINAAGWTDTLGDG